jgi:lipoprotein Spr
MCCSSPEIFSNSQTISRKELREGDLVFFKIQSDQVNHVGVYLQNDHFVHASTQAGVTVSRLNEAYYARYFFKAGRIH